MQLATELNDAHEGAAHLYEHRNDIIGDPSFETHDEAPAVQAAQLLAAAQRPAEYEYILLDNVIGDPTPLPHI